MKSRYSIALYTIIIFVLSTIIITLWYIVKVGSSISISFNTIKNIIFRYGFIGALLPSIFFLSVSIFSKIIKNKWVLSLIIILLTILLIMAGLQFFWYFVVSGLTDNPFVD